MAVISRDNIILEIDARTRKFEQDLSRTEKKVNSFGSQVAKAGKAFAGIFAVVGAAQAIQAVSQFAKASIAAIDAQLKAEAKLLKALGGREDVQKRLVRQAQDLQKQTLFGDEQTIEAQARLASVLGDNEKAITSLIPLVQDFATVKEVDLSTAAELVAKTLGSTTNALSRYGIQVEGAANSSERLESLTQNLGRQVGGQATAAFKAGAGALQAYRNIVGDLQEEIGRFLLPIVNRLATDLSKVVLAVIDFISPAEKLTDTIEKQRVEFNLQIGTLAELTKRLNETSLSEAESNNVQTARKELIKEINGEYGPYLDNLLDEKSSIEDIQKAQEAANNAFKQRILFIAFEEQIAEITKRGAESIKLAAQAETGLARQRAERSKQTQALTSDERRFNEFIEEQTQGIRDSALETANSTDQVVKETTDAFDALAGELGTTLDAIIKRFSNFGSTIEKGDDDKGGPGKKIKEQADIGSGSLAELQAKLTFLQDELQRAPDDPQILQPLAQAVQRAIDDIDELEAKIARLATGTEAFTPFGTIETLEASSQQVQQTTDELFEGELQKTKEAQDKITELQKRALEERLALRKRNAQEIVSESERLFAEIISGIQQANDQRIQEVDREIQIQQDRVNRLNEVDSKATAEQLELEEQRLAKLNQEREQFLQKQRQLQSLEVALNSASAISQGISAVISGFQESTGSGIAKSIALAATLVSAVASIRGVLGQIPAFAEGTEYVKGPGGPKSDSIFASVSRGERIMSASDNAKLKGFPNNKIPEAVKFYKTFAVPGPSQEAINAPLQVINVNTEDLKHEISLMRKDLRAMSVIFNVDDNGIYAAVTKRQNKINHRKALTS